MEASDPKQAPLQAKTHATADEQAKEAWTNALYSSIFFSLLFTLGPKLGGFVHADSPVLATAGAVSVIVMFFLAISMLSLQIQAVGIGFMQRRTVLGRRALLFVALSWASVSLYFLYLYLVQR